jgi:DNA polymerase-3 subunit alpha
MLERYSLHTVEGLAELPNRGVARIGGLVTAVQDGVSKKTGKRYAMITLEDLTGSVQILAMNESYDKYHGLFSANTPLLVTGEVSTGEDKPKIFPMEVMKLDDAPMKYTKKVYLHLKAQDLNRSRLETARGVAESHRGTIPLYLVIQMPGGEQAYLETNERYSISPSPSFEKAIDEVFGMGAFRPISDRTLPERPARKWEKKSGGGGDGE